MPIQCGNCGRRHASVKALKECYINNITMDTASQARERRRRIQQRDMEERAEQRMLADAEEAGRDYITSIDGAR